MRGYELYLVEQWACSRKSPTVVVATYTGNQKNVIVAGVLAVPKDESLWSAKLQVFFKAANQYHARPKETELGDLMVTNLSSFPSALTVIPIPDGDVRKHRLTFFVNEDLKRLGCSGRSGLTLTDPTEATRAKFFQLYKTADRIPVGQSVTELVKLCQIALCMFDKLDQENVDGLLCDVTENAINNWWTEVGAEHYNFEPSDGILGPSTVAALLGMYIGARNRLNWYGAPVPKDAFDIDSMRRGLWYFQKAQKLEKTKRFDRQTLFRLHTATAKAAAGEGWRLEKAVKSTMTEIGGKRGEIVMDMVSGKDKAGLADIETLDIDVFAKLVYGDTPRWLWQGKPRRAPLDRMDLSSDHTSLAPIRTDTQGLSVRQSEDLSSARRVDDTASSLPTGAFLPTADSYVDRDGSRRTVLQSVAGKMSDARSGFGRIKGAVGGTRRGHVTRGSMSAKEGPIDVTGPPSSSYSDMPQHEGAATGPAAVGRAFTWKNKPDEYLNGMRRGDNDVFQDLSDDTTNPYTALANSRASKKMDTGNIAHDDVKEIGVDVRQDVLSRAPSATRSNAEEQDSEGPFLHSERQASAIHASLMRRHSYQTDATDMGRIANENRWARRMSFGDAEEAVLDWEDIVGPSTPGVGPLEQAAHLEAFSNRVEEIAFGLEPWVEAKISMVSKLDQKYDHDVAEIRTLYQQLSEACLRVKENSSEMVQDERDGLVESVKGIEVLVARLEYEINALVAKVHDVEDAIGTYARQVDDIEKRTEDLKLQLETESWPHWFVRTLTGIGTGPNITRST